MAQRQKEKISVIRELIYDLKVGEVMSKNVITLSPGDSIINLRNILRDNRISGTPVLEEGKLIGIISIEDLIKCLANCEIDASISEKMCRRIEVLYEDEPLIHAVNKFDKFGYGRFPVIERENGKLVGIITKQDIVHGLLRRLENMYQEKEIYRWHESRIFFEDIIADRTSIVLEYEIVGDDFKHAGEASSRLKRTLTNFGIHPNTVRRAAIASYEAEMNIVIFTEGGKIIADIQPDQLKLKAVDSGPGIPDIEQAMQPGFSTASERIRELGFGAGMGLSNIKKCADIMDIKSEVGKGTELNIIINLN